MKIMWIVILVIALILLITLPIVLSSKAAAEQQARSEQLALKKARMATTAHQDYVHKVNRLNRIALK